VGNRQEKIPFARKNQEIISAVITEAGRQFDLPDNAEISVTLTDNEGIRELNREYRGIDAPTDVLSFAFDENNAEDGIDFVTPGEIHLLGDIVISLEQAVLQAEEYGHAPERELGFLTVHGMLHLLGFDHNEEEEARKMRDWEEKILLALSLSKD